MRAVVQRVDYSKVEVDGLTVSQIHRGLMVLLGVSEDDQSEDIEYMVKKIPELRIFTDAQDKMNLTVKDVAGSIQLISQFTLYGDARKGRRPSFITAARPQKATDLYLEVAEGIREQGVEVVLGAFGEHMLVTLQNNGPVTILLDSKKGF